MQSSIRRHLLRVAKAGAGCFIKLQPIMEANMRTYFTSANAWQFSGQSCLLCCLMLAGAPAVAAEFQVGINAEVSYRESPAEVRQRFQPVLDELGKLSGHKFEFHPVYSDKVKEAIASQKFDFLLIHTHEALKAEKIFQYQIVGFTDDKKDNTVYFFVDVDNPAQTLKDVAGKKMGTPDAGNWASTTAMAALKEAGITPGKTFARTRYADAVPFLVDLHSAEVGISRNKSVVDKFVAEKKIKVVHQTPALPMNAVIATPKIPASVVKRVREAFDELRNSNSFHELAFKGLRYSPEESQTLHTFYQ